MKHALVSFRVARLLVLLVVPVLCVAAAPRRARADGAFPNSLGPLLPADRPSEILLATNFGVVMSVDAGQTWTYSCEQMSNGTASGLYQMGPAPRDRLFAASDIAFIYTDDRACTWHKATGMVSSNKGPSDYFADAANQNRIWAVRQPDATGGAYMVIESLDGGMTFPTVRYTGVAGDVLNGVELSRSDPNTAYVTMRSGTMFLPKLAVTKNGGTSWTTHDLSPTFQNGTVRIITVDPSNPDKVLLRVSNTVIADGSSKQVDSVALTTNGGTSFVTPNPLTVPDGVLASFVRLPSGTILLGGARGLDNLIFKSTTGGTSFTEMSSPRVVGLGQRDGRVFASTDIVASGDGFSLGYSDDEGATWHKLMAYDEIQAISACAKTMCQDDCNLKVDMSFWADTVCTADPMPKPVTDGGASDGAATKPDAGGTGGAHTGTGGTSGGGTGGVGTGAGGIVGGGGTKTTSSSGCSYGPATDGGAGGGAAAFGIVAMATALALAAVLLRRRRS